MGSDPTAMQAAVTALNTQLNLSAFQDIISMVLPIVGTAVLVGFVFYTVRYAIGLFRGI